MKKLLVFLLIFTIIYIPFKVSAELPSQIRVGLSDIDSASVTVGSAGGFNLKLNEKWIAELSNTLITVSSYSKYYVVVEQSGFSDLENCRKYIAEKSADYVPYYHANGFHAAKIGFTDYAGAEAALNKSKEINPEAYIVNPNESSICISDGNALLITANGVLRTESKGSELTLNSNGYRGVLEFTGKSNKLSIVSILGMEEYICGVVPCEIGGKAPAEALKAQAVCARTYAAVNLGKHAVDGYDLCNTQDCQVYGGMSVETDVATNAVNATANQLLTYNGQPVNAFYSASCGGKTADSKSVWKIDHEYLKSVSDDGCENYTWSVIPDYGKITAALSKKGARTGKLTDMKILEYAEDGSVTKMEFIGTHGSAVFEKEAIKNILGIKSQYFSFTTMPGEKIIPVAEIKKEKNYPYISQKYNVEEILNNGLLMNSTEIVVTDTSINQTHIFGRGYGHRVGMCQLGAMRHAEEGWDYKKILTHYYSGTEIN